MKKLTSLFLALILVLAMAAPAMAATVTVANDLSDHTFVAYQIFAGTQGDQTSESTALGDVVWGKNVNGEAFLTTLKTDAVLGTYFASCVTAADVAEGLSKHQDHSDVAKAFAKFAYTQKTGDALSLGSGANELDAGYYLIVDTTRLTDGDAANAALLQVTGDTIEITVKTDAPEVEKKVKENAKVVTGDEAYGDQYNDVADYNIGDDVPFAFYSAVPDMTYFDTYKYILHDNMDAGLTFNQESVVVKIGEKTLVSGTDYAVVTENLCEGCDFHIVIENLKAIEGIKTKDAIRVDFTAELNSNAVIGLNGNVNKVKLEYSNNPNETASTGNTPWDKVIVFTYELDVTKVDGAVKDDPETAADETQYLKDAEFKLYRMNGEAKEYVTVDANSKVTGWTGTENEATVLTSNENGKFEVIGLDDGTYYLVETKAPAGYNLLDAPIKVVITAMTVNDQNWDAEETANAALTALQISVDDNTAVDGDTESGIVAMTVENNDGKVLPETGGMGTTILYVGGGLLIAAALILLVAKKRTAASK